MGRVSILNPLGEMWSTAILELEIVPPNGANIVWEWHLWDHLVQDSDPDCRVWRCLKASRVNGY